MPLLPQQVSQNPLGPLFRVLTEVYRVDADGAETLIDRSATEYDEAGRMTEQTVQQAGGAVAKTLYSYDAAGRPAEQRKEVNGSAAGRMVHLYDDQGRLSYTLSLAPDGREIEQSRRFYETDGSSVEEFRTDSDVDTVPEDLGPVTRIRSHLDRAGRLLEMRFLDGEDAVRHRIVYHYNSKGLLTDMEQRTGVGTLLPLPGEDPLRQRLLREYAALFSPDTALTTVRYRYDAAGRCLEAVTWMGSQCMGRRTAEYGERGEQLAERHYGRDGDVQSDTVWEREYDGHGNWVVERQVECGAVTQLARRSIQYKSV